MIKLLLALLLTIVAAPNLVAQTHLPTLQNQVQKGDISYLNASSGRVYLTPDKKPEFPGGSNKFYRFITAKVEYSPAYNLKKAKEYVFVSFIVEADGGLSNIHAVEGPSQTLINATVDAVKLSPKWKPGLVKNKPVRVMMSVPILLD